MRSSPCRVIRDTTCFTALDDLPHRQQPSRQGPITSIKLIFTEEDSERYSQIPFETACHRYFKVICRPTDWQSPRHNDDTAHLFPCGYPFGGWTGTVVRDDVAPGLRTPAALICCERVQRRDAARKTAQNIVIKILIDEPQHADRNIWP
jgi:hypothetical protein